MGATVEVVFEGVDNASGVAQNIASAAEGIGSRMRDFGGRAMDIGRGLSLAAAPLALGMGFAVREAMAFEDSMADVSKITGLSGEGLESLGHELRDMASTEIPRTANELAEIASAGGRMGLDTGNLTQFTRQIAEMSVAFDMTASDTADATAKIANNFGIIDSATGEMDFARMEQYGTTVNTLADNMATTERQILNTTQRMSGMANQFGISENETAALAAGFTALGTPAEVAATAFNATSSQLATATSLGPKAQAAFEELGVSAEELERGFAEGRGFETYIDFLQSVQDAENATGSVVDIFGQGNSDEILKASSGLDQFRNAYQHTVDVANGGGSRVSDSFQAMASTTSSQVQLLKNSISSLGIEIGSAILPAINRIVAGLSPLIQGITQFARANPAITSLAVAFAGVAVAIGPVIVAVGALISAFGHIAGAVAIFKASALGMAISGGIASAGIFPIIAAVAAVAVGVYVLVRAFRAVAPAVSSFLSGLDIGGRLSGLRSQLANVFSGIGVMLAPARAALSGLFSNLGVTLAPVRNALSGVTSSITGMIPSASLAGEALGLMFDAFLAKLPQVAAGIDKILTLGGLLEGAFEGLSGGAASGPLDAIGQLGGAAADIGAAERSAQALAQSQANLDAAMARTGGTVQATGQQFQGMGESMATLPQAANDVGTQFQQNLSNSLSNVAGPEMDLSGVGTQIQGQLAQQFSTVDFSGVGQSIQTALTAQLSQLDLSGVATGLQTQLGAMFQGLDLSTAFTGLSTQLTTALTGMSTQVSGMGAQITMALQTSLIQPLTMVGTQVATVFTGIGSQITAALSGIVSQMSAMGAQMSATMSAAFASMSASMSAAIAGVVSQVSAMAGQIQGAMAGVIAAIQAVASQAGAAGAAIGQEMAAGIRSSVGDVQAAASELAGAARAALPGSDAEVGPLSDLTQTGGALVDTFAQGIQPNSGLLGNLMNTMRPVREGLNGGGQSSAVLPSPQAAIGLGGGTGATSTSSNTTIQVTYSPSVSGEGGDLMQNLRQHAEELSEIIRERQGREDFLSFG